MRILFTALAVIVCGSAVNAQDNTVAALQKLDARVIPPDSADAKARGDYLRQLREDGAATGVTIRNVPAFAVALDQTVTVPGLGEVGYDLAFGGNFYAIVSLEKLGLPFERSAADRLLDAGLYIMDAINEHDRPVHPVDPDINGCHHVYLEAPGSDARHSRHAMAIHPGVASARERCMSTASVRQVRRRVASEMCRSSQV